jgi:hypothetical protein
VLLGATYLIVKTEGAAQQHGVRHSPTQNRAIRLLLIRPLPLSRATKFGRAPSPSHQERSLKQFGANAVSPSTHFSSSVSHDSRLE